MRANTLDRPGRIIFIAGVVLVVVSTGLGLYLATPRRDFNQPLDWHQPGYDERFIGVRAEVEILWNVNALMWISLGLGVILTMLGLKLMLIKHSTGRARVRTNRSSRSSNDVS